jgi:hypothetical protein
MAMSITRARLRLALETVAPRGYDSRKRGFWLVEKGISGALLSGIRQFIGTNSQALVVDKRKGLC